MVSVIQIETPKVRLIKGDIDWQQQLVDVWKISRPQSKDTSIQEILQIDAPILDFASFIVEFTVPVFIRDIFCSMREHTVWARTTRVENIIDDFRISTTDAFSIDFAKQCLSEMKDARDHGIMQDQYRSYLPLTYSTTFSTRISVRSLVKFFAYISKIRDDLNHGSFASGIYYNLLLSMHDLFIETGIPINDLMKSIAKIDICPRKKIKIETAMEKGTHFTTLNLETSYSFRAQIIRHRPITFVDNYYDTISSDVCLVSHFGDMLRMSLTSTNDFWDTIVKKRNCWLAQSDMWYPIVKLINKNAPFSVPCDDGHCKFSGDCAQRLNKTDPGLPCPRHAAFNGIKLTDTKEALMNYVDVSLRPKPDWETYINQVTGESECFI